MFYWTQKLLILLCAFSFVMGVVPVSVFAETHDHSTQKEIVAKYHCPMHPWIVSDKPGDCPICHMRLVPIDSGVTAASMSEAKPIEGYIPVVIDPTRQSLAGTQTEVVQKRQLRKTIQTWGVVAHDPKLYQLQIEFLRQERLNYERERNRTVIAQKRGLTEREKIALEFLERGLSPEWVKALEESGVPDKRLIYHHEVDGLWVYLELREQDAVLIKPGYIVNLWPTSFPDKVFQGTIKFIDTLVREETRTVRVHVFIPETSADLKPNTSVSAKIVVDLGESIAVPEDAVLWTGKRALVFVKKENTFEPREVTLGQHAGAFYEIRTGLEVGEQIVSSGNFLIDSESRLRSSIAEAVQGGPSS